jgi:hypothetical protein
MLALVLLSLLGVNQNDPPGVHTLRIIISGSAGFTWGAPEVMMRPHEGVTQLNPKRSVSPYHGKADVNLLPALYDVCVWAADYKPTCEVVKMPDHDAHIAVEITPMRNPTEAQEAQPGLESYSK